MRRFLLGACVLIDELGAAVCTWQLLSRPPLTTRHAVCCSDDEVASPPVPDNRK